MTDRQKHTAVGIVTFLVIIFVTLKYAVFDNRKIEDGVFVIGKLYKKGIQGKNARVLFYYYKYNGNVYYTKLKPMHPDRLIFLKVSKSHPEFSIPVDIDVPGCLTLDNVPIKGWEKMPFDSCR